MSARLVSSRSKYERNPSTRSLLRAFSRNSKAAKEHTEASQLNASKLECWLIQGGLSHLSNAVILLLTRCFMRVWTQTSARCMLRVAHDGEVPFVDDEIVTRCCKCKEWPNCCDSLRFFLALWLLSNMQKVGRCIGIPRVWVVVSFLNVLLLGLPLHSTRSSKAPNPGHMLLFLHAIVFLHKFEINAWVWGWVTGWA